MLTEQRNKSITSAKAEDDPEGRLLDFIKDRYIEKIHEAAIFGKRSLIVEFGDLIEFDPSLARRVLEKPREYLEHASKALWSVLRTECPEYYGHLRDEGKRLHVRFRALPETTPLEKIGEGTRARLIQVSGQVRYLMAKNTPYIAKAVFVCSYCGKEVGPIGQSLSKPLRHPAKCPKCGQRLPCEPDEEKSELLYLLKAAIGDVHGKRCYDLYLLDDLGEADLRLGERIVATVIPEIMILPKARPPRAFIFLEANHVEKVGSEPSRVSPEILEEVKKFVAKDYENFLRIIQAVHPVSAVDFFSIPDFLCASAYCSSGAWGPFRRTINVDLCGLKGWFKTSFILALQRVVGEENLGIASGGGTTIGGLIPTVEKTPEGIQFHEGMLSRYNGKCIAINDAHRMDDEEKSALGGIEDGYFTIAKYGQQVTVEMKESIILVHNWTEIDYDPAKSLVENLGLPGDVVERLDAIYEFIPPPPDVAEEVVSRARRIECECGRGESLTGIPDAWIPAYLEAVKEFYREGGFTIPQEVEEEVEGTWIQAYRYFYEPLERGSWGQSLNIRSLNSMWKFLEMLASMHFRREVTMDDWLFLRDRILPHIAQFMRTGDFGRARLDLLSISIKAIEDEPQREIPMDRFLKAVHRMVGESVGEECAKRILPMDPHLDRNKPLRRLLERLSKVGPEHGFTIVSSKAPGIATRILKNETSHSGHSGHSGYEAFEDPNQIILSTIRDLQSLSQSEGVDADDVYLDKRVSGSMPEGVYRMRLKRLMDLGYLVETSPGRLRLVKG